MGADWRSGYYAVTVTAGDERADAFLVVRPEPGAPGRAPILLVLSTCTWNAYNDWGGPSLYTGAHHVSFERPLAPGFLVKPEPHGRKAQAEPDREALGYFGWAEPRGLSDWSGGAGWWNWERTVPPVGRDERLRGRRRDPAGPGGACPGSSRDVRLYLSVGHDEYWTWGMRDALDAHTAAGGNAAIFRRNTCYWQVRIAEDRRTMTGYKYDVADDPVLGTPDERFLSGAWVDRRVGRPETSTIGLTFTPRRLLALRPRRPAGIGRLHGVAPRPLGLRGHRARYGDALGLPDAIVGYEVDGCDLTTGPDGLPVPTHADGAPATLEVLATAPAQLWSQDQQPSRYAHEPGELENVAEAVYGDAWREHLEEFRYNHAVCGVVHDPRRRDRVQRRRDRLGVRAARERPDPGAGHAQRPVPALGR